MDGLEPNNKLTREQKMGITMLFIFALLTVGLAFLQIRNTLITPFVLRVQNQNGEKSLKDFQVELQNIDTDQDGINDYEELNFYTTSPYLPDTDSDGKTDKQEIDAGTDPLCAEGQECQAAEAIPAEATSTPALLDTPLSQIAGGLSADSSETSAQLQAMLKNPEQIRELLRQTGQIPEAQLNQLDDATLVKLLKEIINAQSKKTEDSASTSLLPSSSSSTVPSSVTSTVEKPK